MSEKDLNIEYICEKTLLNKDDELVPIILDLIQDSYKAGLCQTEFDNTMNLIGENQELKKQLEEYKEQVNKGLYNTCLPYTTGYNKAIKDKENQQKEFINYLEDLIKQNETVVEVSKYGIPKNCSKLLIDFYKIILSKYKKIIGVKDE